MYEPSGYLLEGETAIAEGRNEDATWFWILNPDWQGHCWVWTEIVEVTCDPWLLDIILAPPTPTSSGTPVPACYVRNTRTGGLECIEPCPEDADPGDPCTP